MNKSQLRKHMALILKGLSCAEKQEQSKVVFEKLVAHPKFVEAKQLSLYLSTDNEIDTKRILKYALEVSGKRCFIPFVLKAPMEKLQPSEDEVDNNSSQINTRMIMVELCSMNEYEELPTNNYGIKEPKSLGPSSKWAKPNKENAHLDLMLIPGVAFRKNGQRLGHGKGYYDEFLNDWFEKSMKGSKQPYTIGLAFKEQLVENPLAVEGHDFTLDEILSAA